MTNLCYICMFSLWSSVYSISLACHRGKVFSSPALVRIAQRILVFDSVPWLYQLVWFELLKMVLLQNAQLKSILGTRYASYNNVEASIQIFDGIVSYSKKRNQTWRQILSLSRPRQRTQEHLLQVTWCVLIGCCE